MLDVINGLPGGLRGGAVGHPEEKSGDELNGEGEDESRSPDISPARPAGNVFKEHGMDHGPVAGAVVEPVEEGFSHSLDGNSLMSAGLIVLEAYLHDALFQRCLIDIQFIKPARADRAGDELAVFGEGAVVAGAFE